MKQVLCVVGQNTFGVDIGRVQGIEKKLNLVPVPNSSDLVLGIANLRGNVVPVISLHSKFKTEPNPKYPEKNYIVSKIGDLLVGFCVDQVAEIVEVSKQEFMDMPVILDTEDTSYVDSIIRVKNQLILVLNIEGILSEVERKKLAKIVEEQ